MEVSFYKPLCINNIPEINDTLILFREKNIYVRERKEKKESGDDIKEKNSNGYYYIAVYFILLHNLEADTQRMRMLIPIGTKQYELANLGGRTDMLADTWTNIIITDANQTQGLARIIRQTV